MIGYYLEYQDAPEFKQDNEELFRKLDLTDEDEKPIVVEEIISNNIRLVHFIMNKRYPNMNQLCQRIRVTPDEFFSTGMFALMKAVHTFDISKGFKFATYASMVIHNEYGMFIRSHRRYFNEDNLDGVKAEDGEGKQLTLLDLLVDDNEDLEEIEMKEIGLQLLLEMEKKIKPKDLAILRMYMVGGNQRAIAEELGLSQSYVSRIVKRAMDQARKIYERLTKAG